MRHHLLLVPLLLIPAALGAQTIQNATLKRAQAAYDNLDYRQALTLARAAQRERLNGFDQARGYELLALTYSAMDSILKAVDAFKEVISLEPERELDPNRTSPKVLSAFSVALTQVLVVRQLKVDSVDFVGGQGDTGACRHAHHGRRGADQNRFLGRQRPGEPALAGTPGERRSRARRQLHCRRRGDHRAE